MIKMVISEDMCFFFSGFVTHWKVIPLWFMPYRVITRYPPTGFRSPLSTPNSNGPVSQRDEQANWRDLKKRELEERIARKIQVT